MILTCSRYVELPASLQVSLGCLISQAFETQSYFETFPQLFQPESLTQFLIFVEKSECRAAVALSPLRYVVSGRLYRAVCLGTVCVTQMKQGKGLAKKLISEAIAYSRSLQLDFMLLFSSDPRLYEAMEFCSLGTETLLSRTFTSKERSRHRKQTTAERILKALVLDTRTLAAEIVSQIWSLYQQSASAIAPFCSFLEFLGIIKSTKMKVMLVFEETAGVKRPDRDLLGNKILAVSFYGKGADFENTWHSLRLAEPTRFVQSPKHHQILEFLVDAAFLHEPESLIHFGVGDSGLLHCLEEKSETLRRQSYSKRTFANLMTLELTPAARALFENDGCFQVPSLLST